MKKRIFILLLLTLSNLLPVCAMESSKNTTGKGMSKNPPLLDSATRPAGDDDSDSDSDSDDEWHMPTVGEDSDGGEDAEPEPEDTEFFTPPRERCDYLDLAVPFRQNIDDVVLPSDSSTWSLSASNLPHQPDMGAASCGSTESGLRAGRVLPPPIDIEALPLPPSRNLASVDSGYFGQGLPEDVVASLTKSIDSLFFPLDPHMSEIPPELPPEDDLILPISRVRASASTSATESSSAVAPRQDSHINLATSSASSGAELPADAHWYEREFNAAVTEANRTLSKCKGIIDVTGDTIVVGDLHGDLKTFREIARYIARAFESGEVNCAVFLGDIMDRGEDSALTLLELVQFFNKYKEKVYIIRGNHETREMYLSTSALGKLANNDPLFQYVNKELLFDFFDNLPHAAIINKATLAVHGGVPAEEHWAKFSERKKCREGYEDFYSTGVYEAIWADYVPWFDCGNADPYINVSMMRGGGTLCFNEAAAQEFLKRMGCQYMIRAHQPSLGTFHRSPRGIVTTVFSALENQEFQHVNMALVDKRPAAEPYATIQFAP